MNISFLYIKFTKRDPYKVITLKMQKKKKKIANFYDLFLDVTVTTSNIYILNITILFYPQLF